MRIHLPHEMSSVPPTQGISCILAFASLSRNTENGFAHKCCLKKSFQPGSSKLSASCIIHELMVAIHKNVATYIATRQNLIKEVGITIKSKETSS